MDVRKTTGAYEPYSKRKITQVIKNAFKTAGKEYDPKYAKIVSDNLYLYDGILTTSIRAQIETQLYAIDPDVCEAYKKKKKSIDETENYVKDKVKFIESYKRATNTANATVDDNSNVGGKNVAIINAEGHKGDNIEVSRYMIGEKLKELYPDFDYRQYRRDLSHHIIYKHDESSFMGAIAPYCVSITMYPFLTEGIKGIGGLSAEPKNLDSFCGMFCNLIFAVSSQFAGAVAVSEALLYFTYFAKKEWGDDFYLDLDRNISTGTKRVKTIRSQMRQYWQQMVYTINQPAAARGFQSAFVNFSYFDKNFFEGMFGEFVFPDGTRPDWDSLFVVQKEFMMFLNEERLRTVLTFPVESYTLLYKDGEFKDHESFEFVCEEYERGHSFFTYISDTVDSLSSCCFGGNETITVKVGDSEISIKIKDFVNQFGDETDDWGKKMQTGSKIVSYNGTETEMVDVVGVLKKYYDGDLYEFVAGNRKVTVTPDHIMMVKNLNRDIVEYLQSAVVFKKPMMYELAVDDGKGVEYVKIDRVSKVTNRNVVYDIELEKNHYFAANGIITHNCRLKNKIQSKEFNFTNGNIGVQTGSKSVITTNLSRIVQDWYAEESETRGEKFKFDKTYYASLKNYIVDILERVYKYHHAYNECLWDMYDAGLLPVYTAGFIDLNKQYLTIGINGLNQAAEFLGFECNVNDDYAEFCREIFTTFKTQNEIHKVSKGPHKLTFNTEQVPAESLAVKNYNWDKEDGYWVPEDTNLYASYIYKPNDPNTTILDKIRMMGSEYAGDNLDGGCAAHINIDAHLTKRQYEKILTYSANVGCCYITFNCPNSECKECGYIAKQPFSKCPRCGSEKIWYWDRIIGYLTRIDKWSTPRQMEQKLRVYANGKAQLENI